MRIINTEIITCDNCGLTVSYQLKIFYFCKYWLYCKCSNKSKFFGSMPFWPSWNTERKIIDPGQVVTETCPEDTEEIQNLILQ